MINNLEIPDIVDDSGENYLKSQSFTINSDASDITFETIPSNNEIRLKVNNLSGNYYCDDFRAQEWIFIAYGHIGVDLYTIGLEIGLKFETQTLSDGKVMPYISAVDVDLDINRFDIHIAIWGNIWADLAGAFATVFQGIVCDILEGTAEDALRGIPDILNSALATTTGMSPIPGFPLWFVDYSTPEAAIVTDTSLEAGVTGIMFDSAIGE